MSQFRFTLHVALQTVGVIALVGMAVILIVTGSTR
jgi:hypothetical protein